MFQPSNLNLPGIVDGNWEPRLLSAQLQAMNSVFFESSDSPGAACDQMTLAGICKTILDPQRLVIDPSQRSPHQVCQIFEFHMLFARSLLRVLRMPPKETIDRENLLPQIAFRCGFDLMKSSLPLRVNREILEKFLNRSFGDDEQAWLESHLTELGDGKKSASGWYRQSLMAMHCGIGTYMAVDVSRQKIPLPENTPAGFERCLTGLMRRLSWSESLTPSGNYQSAEEILFLTACAWRYHREQSQLKNKWE